MHMLAGGADQKALTPWPAPRLWLSQSGRTTSSPPSKLTACCTAFTENHIGILIPCCGGRDHCALGARVLAPQAPTNEILHRRSGRVVCNPRRHGGSGACVLCRNGQTAAVQQLSVPCNAGVVLATMLVLEHAPCCTEHVRGVEHAHHRARGPVILHLRCDAVTFNALGIPRFGCAYPCEPATLTGFSPRVASRRCARSCRRAPR